MSTTKFILRPGTWTKKNPKDKKATICKNPEKERSIFLQYSHNGKKVLVKTGHKSAPKDWNRTQGKPKDKNLDSTLVEFKESFKSNAISKVTGEPDPVKVLEAWIKFKEEEKAKLPEAVLKGSLLDHWNHYLDYLRKTLYKGKRRTKGTIRNNENSREKFKEFLNQKDNAKKKSDKYSKDWLNVKPEKFTQLDYEEFDAYLTESLSPNSVAKIKKHFKSFLKWHTSKNRGLLGFDISLVEYSETAGLKISLTEKDLLKIAQADFEDEHLNHVRDLLILQCSTGVRISDLQRLCDHISEDKRYFEIKTKKTGKRVKLVILPLAIEVLKRRNYNIPFMHEQYYRDGIKTIYKTFWPNRTIETGSGDQIKKVLIHEEISSHDMVRTFINIAWKKAISVPTIALYTGKSIQVITKNYLEEDADYASQEILEKFDLSPLKVAR
jgi:hypothetical protein